MPYVRKTKRRPSVSKRLRVIMVACLSLAATLVIGGLYVMQQERLSQGAAEAASFTPAPLPSREASKPRLAVIGDSYTAGAGNDVLWPDLVAEQQGWAVTNLAVGGSGYTSTNASFGEQAVKAVAANPDIILVVGSRNDNGKSAAVAEAAPPVFAYMKEEAPEAQVVVVGPIWSSAEPPADLTVINDHLRQAATEAGYPFVDALSANWLSNPEWIQDDNVHPTDAGEEQLAARINEALDKLNLTVSPE